MKLDRFSRLYGSAVFKQKRSKISEEKIRRIQEELFTRHIVSHLQIGRRKYYLKVIRATRPRPRKKYLTHLTLFLLTVLTTTMTGAMLRGRNPFGSLQDLSYGLPYSFALMSILLVHEMGHYFTSKKYGVDATLPYFIPFFIPAFHPGTMGAFIRIRSAIPNKLALFDIGVAGPFAGFIMSLIFMAIGFHRLPDQAGIYNYIQQIHPLNDSHAVDLVLGNTIIFEGFRQFFHAQALPMNELYHFPFIFAGWFGLLVTALNLMPIGQLDGGHISYAMFEDRARIVAIITFLLLVSLSIYLIVFYHSYVWVMWPLLILIFIRFRHPPTIHNEQGLGPGRRLLGWLAYLIFILCFSPMPIYIQ